MECRLPSEQPVWDVTELLRQVPAQEAQLVVLPALAERVATVMPYRQLAPSALTVGTPWVVVVGGGALIDQIKTWRHTQSPTTRLAAIASVWGSGAEASPIAVTSGASKEILMAPEIRPDVRVRWAALADGLPEEIMRWASGDVLAHALEAILSPLGNDELRRAIADLLRELLAGVPDAATWFELSARACDLQSQASVGLIHGIAHVVEPALWATGDRSLAAHARLCAAWTAPVLRFNLAASPKTAARLATYDLDPEALLALATRLGSAEDVAATREIVRQHWTDIIRDRCTRTNVALVRPRDVDALLEAAA
jgi:alcohol dehydrogenase class IV